MPRPIVDRLNKEMAAVLQDADMRKRLLAQGLVVDTSAPEAITALIKADTARWKTFLPEMHIAPR